jgi:WD40 repeat protein
MGAVLSVAISADGKSVLSGGEDARAILWDVATGQIRQILKGGYAVTFVAFWPRGEQALISFGVQNLELWDLVGGKSLGSIVRGGSSFETASAVGFFPHGRSILFGAGSELHVWDSTKPGGVSAIYPRQNNAIYLGGSLESVALSADGRTALAGTDNGFIEFWDTAKRQLVDTVETRPREREIGSFDRIALAPKTRLAAIVTRARSFYDPRNEVFNETLKFWDLTTRKVLHSFDGGRDGFNVPVFSPDERSVLIGTHTSKMSLWDVARGKLVREFRGTTARVRKVAFSAKGDRILSSGEDNIVRVWDAKSGRLIRAFVVPHTAAPQSLAFSSNGESVLVGNGSTVKLWDIGTGQISRTFYSQSDEVWSVAISPDGRTVLCIERGGGLRLWSTERTETLRTLNAGAISTQPIVISPDGRRLLYVDWPQSITLRDASTGDKVWKVQASSDQVWSVAFSPDGRTAASGSGSEWGSNDASVRLWDALDGRLLRTLEGHTGAVLSVAFSKNGQHILSGSRDGTVKLWDVETGRLLQTHLGHQTSVTSVAFAPDGPSLISGGSDGTVRIWSSGTEIARLVATAQNDWVAITPAGFFSGSSEGGRVLGIVRGLEVTSTEQVHQSLFNPDLVREALAGDPIGEARNAAKLINLEKVIDSGPAPVVEITSPASADQAPSDLLDVRVRIKDRGKGVGRIEWRVNGITAAVLDRPPGSGPEYVVAREVGLDPGDNAIEVVAYNGTNLLASEPARAAIRVNGRVNQQKPKLHILAIGINSYVDEGWLERGRIRPGFRRLTLAVKDAETFATEIKRATSTIYDVLPPKLLLDKDATRENIEREMVSIGENIGARDTFILFVAAHGISEGGRFYLIPQDYQGAPGALQARAIGQDQLQNWLANRIRAKKALILLDTCESGAVVAGHSRSRTETSASEASIGRLHEATGRPILTAAATGQFALEGLVTTSGERRGFFTHALLRALREGDTNGNGTIELSELVAYVQDVLPKLAAQHGGTARAESATPRRSGQSARFGSRGEDFVVAGRLR